MRIKEGSSRWSEEKEMDFENGYIKRGDISDEADFQKQKKKKWVDEMWRIQGACKATWLRLI